MVAAVAGAVLGVVLGAVTKNVVALVVKLVEKRCELWKGFQNDMDFIKRELLMIAGAEEDQHLGKGDPSAVKSISMEEMRDLAHDIEDCLDRILRRYTECEAEASLFHRIMAVGGRPYAAEIKKLKERLKAAHQRKLDYNVNGSVPSSAARPAIASSEFLANTDTARVEPVGIDKPKQELLDLLHDDIKGQPEQLSVISIVGFGGSGKSTLAKAVYDCPDVASRFPCRAWVVASEHRGDTRGLLMALFEELRPGDRANGDAKQLQTDLANYLNDKRYLIVFDDIEEQQWDCVRSSTFPEKTSSRIIVTTTVQAVGKVCSHGNGYVYNMRTLDVNHSKELLEAILKEHSPGFEQRSTSIMNKCDGHPLALVSVANYLLRKDVLTKKDCEQVCRGLGYHMAKEYAFRNLQQVLMKHYSSLPGHLLKTCLLYICVFPNGHHIRRNCLMRRWLAEGYVQSQHPRSASLVADENFEQLIDQNLIRPIESSKNAKVKTCKAHGIMHEFMLHLSNSAKFITSLDNPERSTYRHLFMENNPSGSASDMNRHTHTSPVCVGTSQSKNFRARSLTIYGRAGEATVDLAKCELLRVLDLKECNDLKDEYLDGIHELWYLRYLSLSKTIRRVPREIEKLHCLETLDMRKTTREIELPVGVMKLPHLAHLLGKFKLGKRKWKKNKPEKYMPKESNLQTLAGFVTDDSPGFPKLMIHMKKLRKVKIWCDSTGEDLLEAIKQFIQVDIDTSDGDRSLTLYLENSSGKILTSLDKSLENSYGYLSSLKLHGALRGLTQFEFITLLFGLKELCLSSTNNLMINEISNLRKLIHLEYLKLVKVSFRDFIIRRWDFPRLLRLCIVQSLTFPTIEEGALRNIISLQLLSEDIGDLCGVEIRRHERLQEVALDSEIKKEAKRVWEDAAKNHPKRPRILYLQRVDLDGTGSMVKYIAAKIAAPETECSGMQEERQIPTDQSISVEEISSALEHVNVVGPSVASTELPSVRNDDPMATSTKASFLVEAQGLQPSSSNEMMIDQELPVGITQEEAKPDGQENGGEVSSNSQNPNFGGPKHGKPSRSADDHGKMKESDHYSSDEDDGEDKNYKRNKSFSGYQKAMAGVVIKETAADGFKSFVQNTVITGLDNSCGKGKGKVDEIPKNAIQVTKDTELALKLQKLEEQSIRGKV